MSISIATLGMFNRDWEITMSPPLKVSINGTSIICNVQKSDVVTSLSATKISTNIKNMELSINLNKDELKLIAKET